MQRPSAIALTARSYDGIKHKRSISMLFTKQTISTYASGPPIRKFTHLNAFYQQYSQPRVIDSAGVSGRLFATVQRPTRSYIQGLVEIMRSTASKPPTMNTSYNKHSKQSPCHLVFFSRRTSATRKSPSQSTRSPLQTSHIAGLIPNNNGFSGSIRSDYLGDGVVHPHFRRWPQIVCNESTRGGNICRSSPPAFRYVQTIDSLISGKDCVPTSRRGTRFFS
jgi:hypothetical protein